MVETYNFQSKIKFTENKVRKLTSYTFIFIAFKSNLNIIQFVDLEKLL